MKQPKVQIELRRNSNMSDRYQIVKLVGAISVQTSSDRPHLVGAWLSPSEASDLLCVENYVVTVKIK